jgi:cytochrome c biogenesis protein CcdA
MAEGTFLLASVIVSFLAGIVALAMPCCFSVLLPSYFASCFKRRAKMFGMTLIFALGVAAVLLPIALGVTAISIYIGLNHSLLFVIGGFFMLFIGLASFLGIQLLPMMHPDVDLQRTGMPTVFALGAFSGVASSCCAPVLAGMLVLTALASSVIGSTLVGLTYVAGMVFPLFLVSLFMDRSSGVQKVLQGTMLRIGGQTVHSSRLLSAGIFVSMGLVTVYLGFTNTMLATPGSEIFNIYEAAIQRAVDSFVASPISVILFVGATLLGIGLYLGRRLNRGITRATH